MIFMMFMGLALASALFIVVLRQRQFFKRHPLILTGAFFLTAFIFLRAAIFNHLDSAAGMNMGEGKWMASLELIGIGCFIVASLRAAKTRS